jgi:hypothetical protein
MKKLLLPIVFALAITGCSSFMPSRKAPPEPQPTIRLTLLPQGAIAQNKTTTVQAKLNIIETRTLLTDDDLAIAHTKKFHLLVVDPTLTDYQHIHPQPTNIPGVYSFQFTPKLAGGYRAWADVTPKATGKQEYVMADLGVHKVGMYPKTEMHEASAGGYHFTLSFDKPPVADDESMGTIKVTDAKGNPVSALQPIMGAYAHIVGFYDDYRHIVHVHPMGEEPKNESQRGGPELTFHLAPTRAGFIKLFAQVRINGKEIFAPFGINVSQ